MASENQPIYIRSVLNFRDAGGLPTVDGKRIKERFIFRSAKPDNISRKDLNRLHKLNIRTIVDLRAPYETGRKNKKFDGIQTISLPLDFERTTRERLIPLLKQKDGKDLIPVLIDSLYLEILDGSVAVFKKIIELLLDPNNTPMLIHCQAGKDRTGIICALIQLALDADRQSIINGYMTSNEMILPYYKRMINLRKIISLGFFPADKVLYAITVRSNNIESVIERVISHYGGIEGYLRSSDGGRSDVKKLRELFT